MKKHNLYKLASIAFLSAFVLTMYATKFKSIILGVDLPSYLIFAFVTIICGLLLLNVEDIQDWLSMISKKDKNTKEVPDTVYAFCKKYYFESEAETIRFVKEDVENKDLANFFVRYLDKNTIEEVDEYLATQEVIANKKRDNARKVVSYNNLFILIGVVGAYIYDSNIKGVLLIAGLLSVYNLAVAKNIEKNILSVKQLNLLYKSIALDVLEFRNAKYIMYKCKNILMLDDEYVTVDTIELPTVQEQIDKSTEKVIAEANNVPVDMNIESRKSALFTIGKSKKAAEDTSVRIYR